MRANNISAILEFVRSNPMSSINEISRQLDINLSVLREDVDLLFGKKLLSSFTHDESGQILPRSVFKLNSAENAVIGIDLGGSHIGGAAATIDGKIIGEVRLDSFNAGGGEVFEKLASLIHQLMDITTAEGMKTLGIAVGVPGTIQGGIVGLAPAFGWKNYPLLTRLGKIFSLPLLIENDLNLAAKGEHRFGAGQGVDSMVMIAIGTGIGAGIILDGRLYRGYRGASGEIGHLVPGTDCLNNHYDGFGALESLASGRGIRERARKMIKHTAGPDPVSDIDPPEVFKAAREKREWAVRVVDETINYLSIAIANVTVLLDPELIVLGGGVLGSADMIIEPVIKRLTGVIPRIPVLKKAELKHHAVCLGALDPIVGKTLGRMRNQTKS